LSKLPSVVSNCSLNTYLAPAISSTKAGFVKFSNRFSELQFSTKNLIQAKERKWRNAKPIIVYFKNMNWTFLTLIKSQLLVNLNSNVSLKILVTSAPWFKYWKTSFLLFLSFVTVVRINLSWGKFVKHGESLIIARFSVQIVRRLMLESQKVLS